jgi:hypothetical protein
MAVLTDVLEDATGYGRMLRGATASSRPLSNTRIARQNNWPSAKSIPA